MDAVQATIGDVMTWCGSAGATLPGLLLAGLTGGAMHCGPMCGGFVLGQVSDRMARLPAAGMCESARISSALLLPYHVGRLTTYALLGALAASLGAAAGGQAWFSGFSGALLLSGALLFGLQAAARLSPGLRSAIPGWERAPAGWTRALAGATRKIDRTSWSGGLLLGLALGFLPCGLLYAALAIAAASGSAGRGATAMVLFGLGTVPSLVAVGLAGHIAGRRWRRRLVQLAPALLFANAALLLLLAWQRFNTMS
jgi:sulfite exporter TauE/SafE